MRLIDADDFCKRFNNMAETYTDKMIACIVNGAISSQPTAYDVDKVVEELELHSFEFGSDILPAHYVRLNEAIEITKQHNKCQFEKSNECASMECCSDCDKYYDEKKWDEFCKQLVEWLEELRAIKELDLEIPQHFTKEQSDWIKKYVILKKKEAYDQALEDFYKALEKNQQDNWIDNLEYGITFADVEEVINQLKK